MKRLLTRSCLIAGLACAASCATTKEPAPQETASVPAPQPEQTVVAERPAPWAPAPPSKVLPEEEDGEISSAPAVLPGDFRPGLRTPSLPDNLLYDLSGKLTTPTAP